MFPRGLRIKKPLTTIYSEEFQLRWENILTTCSTDLIKLIVEFEEKTLEELDDNISKLQEAVIKLVISPKMESIMENIVLSLKKLEDQVIVLKQKKFQRDIIDYSKRRSLHLDKK